MKRTKKYIINITKRDIARGRKNRKNIHWFPTISCPAFLSAKRVIPTLIRIGAEYLYCRSTIVGLPSELVNWIRHFDNNKRVRPAKFTIVV